MNILAKTSNFIDSVDTAFIVILGISFVFLVAITAVMVYFIIRYNRKRSPEPTQIKENVLLEVIWTVVPTILVLVMFYYGWRSWFQMRKIPENTFDIRAISRMWSFSFEYENGLITDTLYIPQNTPVKLELISQDVIHCLYIPAFRIKQDMVPGATNYMWFMSERTGRFDLFCAEYCGQRHSYMITKTVVKSQNEFDKWYSEASQKQSSADTPEAKGLQILKNQGCFACHSIDGSKLPGPTFKGLMGSEKIVLVNGKEKTITADNAYIKRSTFEPNKELVKGFLPIMLNYKGKVKEEEIDFIIAYLKTLK